MSLHPPDGSGADGMSPLRKALEDHVAAMAYCGQPAILERFVLRNGIEFPGQPKPADVPIGESKACFKNAGLLAFREGWDYYEGIGLTDIGFHTHHAWNMRDGQLIDTTWRNPEAAHYMGVKIEIEELRLAVLTSKMWGVLTKGIRFNHEWMFEADPGLEAICAEIRARGTPPALRRVHVERRQGSD